MYMLNVMIQGGLYPYLINKVDGFRSFIGAPETERFNLVLLGGKCPLLGRQGSHILYQVAKCFFTNAHS